MFDAGTGGEALNVCRQHRGAIDLLITDLLMAGGPAATLKGETPARLVDAVRASLHAPP